ncbi:hypothetical protein P389DRAFT_62293 [Cystobasidium minutum MCA 4210]|uniref:uncharacterized protein n=1 Tax=Cystobasidium minutum MCA 4210 TaxID=1397322 RepID=UPI0034CD0BAC|eukprot:jgi/Rhomi1/62293/CE62292_168
MPAFSCAPYQSLLECPPLAQPLAHARFLTFSRFESGKLISLRIPLAAFAFSCVLYFFQSRTSAGVGFQGVTRRTSVFWILKRIRENRVQVWETVIRGPSMTRGRITVVPSHKPFPSLLALSLRGNITHSCLFLQFRAIMALAVQPTPVDLAWPRPQCLL